MRNESSKHQATVLTPFIEFLHDMAALTTVLLIVASVATLCMMIK